MIVVAIPITVLMVRSRSPQVGARTTMPGAAPALDVPGFELAEAARTRSFWMIRAAQFSYAYVSASTALHLITYLIAIPCFFPDSREIRFGEGNRIHVAARS